MRSRRGMNPEKILPTMDDWEVFPRVATATALRAMAEGGGPPAAQRRGALPGGGSPDSPGPGDYPPDDGKQLDSQTAGGLGRGWSDEQRYKED